MRCMNVVVDALDGMIRWGYLNLFSEVESQHALADPRFPWILHEGIEYFRIKKRLG